jgi:Icc-related predicted phosphoesterase
MKKEINAALNRRRFIGNIGKAGFAGLLPFGQFEHAITTTADTSDSFFVTRPYLQNLTSTSCTIMWITAQPCASWVEFGVEQPQQKAVNSDIGLVDANNLINKITLEGLQPGKKYCYRASSREIKDFQPYSMKWGNRQDSEVFYFTTPNPRAESVSWVMLNDIHDRPASFPLLLSLVKDFHRDFVFLNGDMFDYETDQQQIVNHLLNPLGDLFSHSVPFMFTRGNHETRGRFARNHSLYFENPGSKYYFSFTQGPVYFLTLDTGEDKEDSHEVYQGLVAFDAYREEQARWLEREIETPAFKKAPFRVVMMHIPPFESGDWRGTMHCRQLFNPLFNRGKIDLLICGHTHRHGTHLANADHHYPMIIGGGPLESKRTVITVTANNSNLELAMLRDDGIKVGELNISSQRRRK